MESEQRKEKRMKFSIMDHTGHSTEAFDIASATDLAAAEKRFNELVGLGKTAAVRTGNGEGRITRSFDGNAAEILFIPRYQGG